MKIKAKEIINSFGDIMFARYINLAMFMRSYRHSRGFAIISFLRKITINGENQMKNTDILDKRGENGNNPSAHDVSLYLRCFSKKHEDQWVSICIDLNLAAQADTQKESRRKLESMIRTYVYEAYTCHSKYKKQLLNRKAPLSMILEYYKILALKSLLSLPIFRQNSTNNDIFPNYDIFSECSSFS
jgi:hypothetical protein